MRCTSPRTVGFKADGTTISWNGKGRSPEYPEFKLPCSKCIECRLEYSTQLATRCVHESMMYEKNSFVTLTYSDEHLPGPKLHYPDFQKFLKRLRKTQSEPIPYFVVGEYGEKTKRPHWHAILFNYSPGDIQYLRTTDRGDRVSKSDLLDKIWGKNDPIKKPNEIGSVTFESAAYCARYSAKKLVHGRDGAHDYNPISKRSCDHAIGKKWLESFYPDIFLRGRCFVGERSTSIPRYYEKWLQKNHPSEWIRYVTQTKSYVTQEAIKKSDRVQEEWLESLWDRYYAGKERPKSPDEVRKIIVEDRFQKLQEHLKL